MEIVNAIREANTDYEIYFLLTSYIDAVRFCDKLRYMPEPMSALPLAGKADLQARFERLLVELDQASKRLDDQACYVIKEALTIFSAALNRLWSIDSKRRAPSAGVDRQAVLSWSSVPLTQPAALAHKPVAASNSEQHPGN
jgi:hypothetical protein